jgi:hypothetical protein
MEKWIIGILCILVLLSACGIQEAKEELQDKAAEGVNLKCTFTNAFTIYFLDEKAKVVSEASESWVMDNYGYTVIKIGDTNYIIKSPVTPTEMDYTAMKDAYYSSKFVQNMDCVEGVVTEEEMQLPNYPVMTPEELQQKMTEQMMQQYSQ